MDDLNTSKNLEHQHQPQVQHQKQQEQLQQQPSSLPTTQNQVHNTNQLEQLHQQQQQQHQNYDVKFKSKKYSTIATEKMKSAILYPYGPLSGSGCCRTLHAKHLAMTSAVYTFNISILIVLLYAWRVSVNVKRSDDLEDVYYGVQIAYIAIIGTQMSMIILSVMLMFGIYKENSGLIVPWIIGFITFMALEAVAMVYSNVLRDHVNRQFDAMCKAEVAFFIARAFINILAMWGVMRFYNLLRAGITWKGPEVIEL